MTTQEEQLIITKYDLLYEQRMTHVETSMSNLDNTLKEIKSEINDMKNDIREIRDDMKTDFRWLLGVIIALAGIMAHGFHWF